MFPDCLKARYLNRITDCQCCLLNILIALLILPACTKTPDSKTDEVVLNQRMRSKVQTLDPADVGDTASHGVCSEFHESLYTYHYLKRPH
ncbi:MAG: hypothetical protein ACYSSM_05295, partial [Planctomycetota bacterium]